MPPRDPPRPDGWNRAALAASLFAVDCVGVGGIAVRARPGPVRDLWLELVRDLMPMIENM